MNKVDIESLVNNLLETSVENEWIEFKEAKTSFDSDDLGKYFSALSNEANLNQQPFGYLIFGIQDKHKKIVGTHYLNTPENIQKIKHTISHNTSNNYTFVSVEELFIQNKRILVFIIPPAPPSMPVAWKGVFYGRNGSSLVPLNLNEIKLFLNQVESDWSANIAENASLKDLDQQAIVFARKEFSKKNPTLENDMPSWNDLTFLNRIQLAVNEKITKSAILLLGKQESEYFLTPYIPTISWILKDKDGVTLDYYHFNLPFILTSQQIFTRIRNLKIRYMPSRSLFPEEIDQYDSYTLREALNNCIAHQDYRLNGLIRVLEMPDQVIFQNMGSFLPGSIQNVIQSEFTPAKNRNPRLTQVMNRVNMIDQVGSGIQKMFRIQKERFFPLPEYEISEKEVKVTIYGKILNEGYTLNLMDNKDLTFEQVFLLDQIQKGKMIPKEAASELRSRRLVEGRYPHLFISSPIADITEKKEQYIKNRAFDDDYYRDLIVEYLKKFKTADRQNINKLLFSKLPEKYKTEKEKSKKTSNILTSLVKQKIITNQATRKEPLWSLVRD